MIIIAIGLVLIILYLLKDNEHQAANNPDPVDRTWKLGAGWLIIIVAGLALMCSVLPYMATGVPTNIGYDDAGNFTMHQTPDPNNPLAGSVGELLGMQQDAQGHWSRK